MASPTPKSVARKKPPKPHQDFPLFPHASGQWAKKINRKTHYFGTWADPQVALERYLDQKDDLLAGRIPTKGHSLTVGELVNQFLTSKQRLVDSGDLEPRTWESYDRRMPTLLDVFGKGRNVEKLRPVDFEKLRAEYAKSHGSVTLKGDVGIVRMLFKYAYESDLIDRPVKFGQNFKTPSRATLRLSRQKNGKRMFEASQLRDIITEAKPQLRAMIYLGINCGFGNHDCAMLPLSVLDLKSGWIDFDRTKTGIERRCPLWPETVAAMRVAIEKRPQPKEEANAGRAFITKYGNTWEPKTITDNPISKEIVKVLKKLGIHRKGLAFYALRHTFNTQGLKTRDKDAVRAIMGRVEDANDMSAVYNEEPIEDERLKNVTDYVRYWLNSTQ